RTSPSEPLVSAKTARPANPSAAMARSRPLKRVSIGPGSSRVRAERVRSGRPAARVVRRLCDAPRAGLLPVLDLEHRAVRGEARSGRAAARRVAEPHAGDGPPAL